MADQVADPSLRRFPDHVDPAFIPHFAGLQRDEVVIRSCRECGAKQWPPRAFCARCAGTAFEDIAVDGKGVVYTFTVVHRAFDPFFADRVPYGIVVVEVDDGIRLLGNYAGDVAELACGLPVVATFETAGRQAFLMWARRAEGQVTR